MQFYFNHSNKLAVFPYQPSPFHLPGVASMSVSLSSLLIELSLFYLLLPNSSYVYLYLLFITNLFYFDSLIFKFPHLIFSASSINCNIPLVLKLSSLSHSLTFEDIVLDSNLVLFLLLMLFIYAYSSNYY